MKNRNIFLIVLIGIVSGLIFELTFINFLYPEEANVSLIGVITPDCTKGNCTGVIALELLITSIIAVYSLYIAATREHNWKAGTLLYGINFIIGASIGYLIP